MQPSDAAEQLFADALGAFCNAEHSYCMILVELGRGTAG